MSKNTEAMFLKRRFFFQDKGLNGKLLLASLARCYTSKLTVNGSHDRLLFALCRDNIIPYPTAFPYGNGMVLHFYQQQESSTTKTVHKVINKGLKTYV